MAHDYISLKAFRAVPEAYTQKEIGEMCTFQRLSFKFMRDMKEYLNWTQISYNKQTCLTEAFITEMKDYIDWEHTTWNYGRGWSNDFIRANADYVDWLTLIKVKRLDEDFIIEMAQYIPFDNLLIYQITNYSEEFLRTLFQIAPKALKNGLETNTTNLSKNFLREIQEKVNPSLFVYNRIHNWEMLKEWKEHIKDMNKIFREEDHLDIDIILRYKENICLDKDYFIQWLYKFDEKKKKEIVEFKNYFDWYKQYTEEHKHDCAG